MKKLDIIKAAAELVASIAVGTVVGNAIKAGTPVGTRVPMRIFVGIGGFILSSMVGDAAGKYTTDMIDDAAERINEIVNATVVSEISVPVEVPSRPEPPVDVDPTA